MDELVDVVDEQGTVLRVVTKQEAHKKGLLHKTVISGVKTSDGRIMLVRQNPDRQDAGQYVNPVGGHVTSGESEDEAIKRETEEELGWKDIQFHLVGKVVFNRFVKNRQENHLFVVYEIFNDMLPQQLSECDDFEYFTLQHLSQELKDNPKKFGDSYHFVVKQFYSHLLS